MPEQLLVLLRGSGSPADVRRTTESLEQNTPGLEGGVARIVDLSGGAAEDRLWELVRESAKADLVLLRVGLTVGPGWSEALRTAAYGDVIVATASAVPAEALAGSRAGDGLTAASAAGTALGEPVWDCVYVRRDALDVALTARSATVALEVGARPRLEEILLVPGLVHVLASTIVRNGGDTTTKPDGQFLTPAVRGALAKLEVDVEPLRVMVDLRCCAYVLSGTQVHALNLVAALARREDMQVSVLLPRRVESSVRPHVEALPASVTRVHPGDSDRPPPQVFHRPYQLLTENEITDVLSQGARLVLTHQDMILDRTPAYFPSKEHWRGYAAATALSFVAADEVAFFSEHARNEAIRDGLVDPAKTSVVPPGTNHLDGSAGEEKRPGKLGSIVPSKAHPFVLVLCNSYFHKNRLFALRVADELRRQQLWDGALVFAGGNPPDGSSAAEEASFLADRPELRARFVDLDRVSDEEQRWLYRYAALVLYPSLYEGFGLIPFETAAAGTPCVYSSRSSVAEFLPAEGALLDLADAHGTAAQLAAVLDDSDARGAIVRAIRRAGETLTWDGAAASYVVVYRRALQRPVGLALAAGGEVIVGARSQVAADETERMLLLMSRRIGAIRLMTRAALRVAPVVQRLTRRR